MNPEDTLIPRLPFGSWVETGIDWLTDNFEPFFEGVSTFFTVIVEGLSNGLLAIPALVLVVVFALLAFVVRSWQFAIGTVLMFLIVLSLRMWEPMIQTMALVLVATVIAVVIGVPVGILAAKNRTVSAIVKPILDFMQSMPAFVYLIPAVVFFSIGVVPGMVSTIIFALPPAARMAELGIRGVDSETVEAGESFGASPWQILTGIQIPLSIPTIMAGVNQVIMLSLSMAVIAGMVGAPGLGKVIVDAISNLETGQGVEAGLAVVFLAVFLDRLTAALGSPGSYRSSLIALVRGKKPATS